MSNPKYRTPIEEKTHKPDVNILSEKVATENPELVKQFDRLAVSLTADPEPAEKVITNLLNESGMGTLKNVDLAATRYKKPWWKFWSKK